MAKHEVVTIGGSAGSLEALRTIVRDLPKDLPAAIFIVMHMSPRAKSVLPSILHSALPAVAAREGDRIEPGRIYVACPDQHLMIAKDHIHLTRGPKEGLHRPSINVTFRSAAASYRDRVIGVLLSGMLDDGAAGMWEIAQSGGVTIVQDPAEALFPSMPLNALADAEIHYRSPVAEISKLLARIIGGEEMSTSNGNRSFTRGEMRFSGLTCPECRGPLFETQSGPVEFRCRVGHVLSPKTLLDEHTSTQERKLYEAIVALEEGAELAEYTARHAGEDQRQDLNREAEQLRRHAATIRQLLEERLIPSID